MKRVETETLILHADGFALIIRGAPVARNRNERGVKELLRRITATRDETGTWDELRELAGEVGVLIDPLDDPSEGDRESGGLPRRWFR